MHQTSFWVFWVFFYLFIYFFTYSKLNFLGLFPNNITYSLALHSEAIFSEMQNCLIHTLCFNVPYIKTPSAHTTLNHD